MDRSFYKKSVVDILSKLKMVDVVSSFGYDYINNIEFMFLHRSDKMSDELFIDSYKFLIKRIELDILKKLKCKKCGVVNVFSINDKDYTICNFCLKKLN